MPRKKASEQAIEPIQKNQSTSQPVVDKTSFADTIDEKHFIHQSNLSPDDFELDNTP